MQMLEQSNMDQKIIASEELFRIQGSNSQQVLHRSIGALTFLNKDKQMGYGSGVLISKNIVLTGAHNVYDKLLKNEYSDFKFYLGINGVAKNYYEVEDMRYMQEYKSCQLNEKTSYDFALLKLKIQVNFSKDSANKKQNLFQNPENQFLQLSLCCQKCIMKNNRQTFLSIFGFPKSYFNYKPKDQFGDSFDLYQYGLVRNNRIIAFDVQKNKICYAISTLPGQSGCPVVIGKRIIAVHVGAGNKNQQFNIGSFFDLQLFNRLKKWGKQLKGDAFDIYDGQDLCPHIKQSLYLSQKQIKQINVSEYMSLTHLWLYNNQLSAIDITKNTNLTHLSLYNNQLSAIDITKNTNLTDLYLSNNQLSGIDVTKNTNLTRLSLYNNQLSAIDITKNTNLTDLYISNNQLSTIDVTKNTNLTLLYLYNNQLSAIDVTKNTNLTDLSLSNNQLSAIDVTKNTNLTRLSLYNNQLSAIDITKNTNLTDLSLSNNQLSAIDVTKNTNLTLLSLSNNQLSAIDVTKNTNLTDLSLSNNQLSAIDVTKNTSLTYLSLQNNKFISISLLFSPSKPLQKYLNDLYFNFSYQYSDVCEIQLQYNNADKSKCYKLKDKWTKKYLKQEKYNKHGCKYTFIRKQRSQLIQQLSSAQGWTNCIQKNIQLNQKNLTIIDLISKDNFKLTKNEIEVFTKLELPNIKVLSIENHSIKDDGLQVLCQKGDYPSLITINLQDNGISINGVKHLLFNNWNKEVNYQLSSVQQNNGFVLHVGQNIPILKDILQKKSISQIDDLIPVQQNKKINALNLLLATPLDSQDTDKNVIQQSKKLQQHYKANALQGKKNIADLMLALKQSIGKSIKFTNKQSIKTKLTTKIISAGIIGERIKYSHTFQHLDNFKFSDFKNNHKKIKQFQAWYMKQLKEQYGVDVSEFTIDKIIEGSINVIASFFKIFDQNGKFLKQIQELNFFERLQLNQHEFDQRFNYAYPQIQQPSIQTRGGFPYYQPVLGKRFAIKLENIYGSNDWLMMDGNKNEWAVGFHGVNNPTNKVVSDKSGRTVSVMRSIMDGRLQGTMLKSGTRNACEDQICLRSNKKIGKGIYISPYFLTGLFDYSYICQGQKYHVVLQCRVRPDAVRIAARPDYWVINQRKDIRPYGIILFTDQDINQLKKGGSSSSADIHRSIYKEEFTKQTWKDKYQNQYKKFHQLT